MENDVENMAEMVEVDGLDELSYTENQVSLMNRSTDIVMELRDEIKRLTKIIIMQREKLRTADKIFNTPDVFDIGVVVKTLQYPGYGKNTTIQLLKNEGILMKNGLPNQKYVDKGYFKVIMRCYEDKLGYNRVSSKTMVTGQGINFIRKILTFYTSGRRDNVFLGNTDGKFKLITK